MFTQTSAENGGRVVQLCKCSTSVHKTVKGSACQQEENAFFSNVFFFFKCILFLHRPHSPKHSLTENKRIGEIPILRARTHESDRTTHDHERTTAGS